MNNKNKTEGLIITVYKVIIDYYLKKSEMKDEMIDLNNDDEKPPEQLSLF